MDPKDYNTVEKILDSLTTTDTDCIAVPNRYGAETVTVNNAIDTITLSGLDFNLLNTMSPNYSNVTVTSPYTMSGGTGLYTTGTTASPWATHASSKIRLDGKDADIEVNGLSLMDAIQKIEERLNILHPNEKLEEEWEELRVLGEQYRKLEQHIKDKQATWDKLKAMPPPMVDQ
jgi:FtsZ-binding cell division protein ZapB